MLIQIWTGQNTRMKVLQVFSIDVWFVWLIIIITHASHIAFFLTWHVNFVYKKDYVKNSIIHLLRTVYLLPTCTYLIWRHIYDIFKWWNLHMVTCDQHIVVFNRSYAYSHSYMRCCWGCFVTFIYVLQFITI